MKCTPQAVTLGLLLATNVALFLSPLRISSAAAASDDDPDGYAREESLAVAAASRASVHSIDSTLPDIRFDSWFRNLVGPDARVSWEANDCGEGTGSPADSENQIPLCAEARAEWRNGAAYVWLMVGTGKRGVVDVAPPEVFYWEADTLRADRSGDKLSDFARAVEHVRPVHPH